MNSVEFIAAMDRYVGRSQEPFTNKDAQTLREGIISIFEMKPAADGKFTQQQDELIDQKLIEVKNFLKEAFKPTGDQAK